MKTEERLIVAVDFSPKEHGGRREIYKKVMEFATLLKSLGVYIKVNTILRAVGYQLIDDLHDLGLKVFADLKLIDIPNTMTDDALFLLEAKPEIVTVMCCAGVDGTTAVVKNINKDIKVLGERKTQTFGVTILTSLEGEKCRDIFSCYPEDGVIKFAHQAKSANLDGLILSPQEASVIKKDKELVGLSLNTPGIRPEWAIVKGDDQARVMTPKKAIEAGVHGIVVGRPITQAKNPRDAVLRTLEEIKMGLESRKK